MGKTKENATSSKVECRLFVKGGVNMKSSWRQMTESSLIFYSDARSVLSTTQSQRPIHSVRKRMPTGEVIPLMEVKMSKDSPMPKSRRIPHVFAVSGPKLKL